MSGPGAGRPAGEWTENVPLDAFGGFHRDGMVDPALLADVDTGRAGGGLTLTLPDGQVLTGVSRPLEADTGGQANR